MPPIDLTNYMKTLNAGAPRFGAWFRSTHYAIEADFGASQQGGQPPLEGIRIRATGELAFCAPFNGFVQFATPQTVGLAYAVAGEKTWVENLHDPTLRGLRNLDGSPFRTRRQIRDGDDATSDVPGYVMLFTIFPHAYLRLKRLFQEFEHGASATKRALRPIPHRFAIVFHDKRQFVSGFAALNGLIRGPLSGALNALKKIGWVDKGVKFPGVDVERSADGDGKIGPAPRYAVKAGAEVMRAQADWIFDLHVFDEHGWPMDPVYAWHVLRKIAEKFKGVQEGQTYPNSQGRGGKNPLQEYALSGRTGVQRRLFLHTIDLHGGPAAAYLSKGIKVGPSGQYTLPALGSGPVPPLRRVTLSAGTRTSGRGKCTIELDASALNLSQSKSSVALGLYPNGALQDSSAKVTHQALDYDFLRLALVDLTHHVGRNQPAATDETAKEAFPKTGAAGSLREHQKETHVSVLGDGKQIVGQVGAQLKRAAGSGVGERLVRLMTPQLDPHLHLAGRRSGVGAVGAWQDEHQTNLKEIEQRLTCYVAGVKDGLDVQVLVAQEKTFPAGAFVRLYHATTDLTSGSVRRGDGSSTTVLANGGFVLALPVQKNNFQRIDFDLLVVTWEKKKGQDGKEGTIPAPHFRAGITCTGLPTRRTDRRKIKFEGESALTYDAAKGALLKFEKAFSKHTYDLIAVLPRTGKVSTSTYTPNAAHEMKIEGMDGADEVFLGLRATGKAKLEDCVLWQRYCFGESARAAAAVPLAADTALARLKAVEKAQKEKLQVLVNESLSPIDGLHQRTCEAALGEKRFAVDSNAYLPMVRAESALYVHTKTSSTTASGQERQTAVVSGAPLLPGYTNTEPDEIGNPDAPAGPDVSTIGVALEGRAAHLVYQSFQSRARKALSGFTKDNHKAATPTSTVKSSTHRAALLRTLPALLDADKPTTIKPGARRDQLLAVADAIKHARRSIYIEGPFFEVYDRESCDDHERVFDPRTYNLAQLIHRRLLVNPDLLVIVCLPQQLHHPWGKGAAKLLREARVRAVRTARYDGYADKFQKAHQGQEKVFTQALPVHERLAVFHPRGFMGRPLELSTSIVIVDDVWASVGNAGFRRRSLGFDSGLNVALSDLALVEGAPKLVHEMRVNLMQRALNLAQEAVRDDGPRIRRFEDAFATVRGLCQRNLTDALVGYDEKQTRAPLGEKIEPHYVNCRELVDPDGEKASTSYAAALTALWPAAKPVLKAIGLPVDHLGQFTVTWKAPGAPSGAVKFVICLRRDQPGASATETVVELKPDAGVYKHVLYLNRKTTYKLQVWYTAADGKRYESAWSTTASTGTPSLDATTLDLDTLKVVSS